VGHGGGISIVSPSDPQHDQQLCAGPPFTYWNYSYNTAIELHQCTISFNLAACPLCAGGGLLLAAGGTLLVEDTEVVRSDFDGLQLVLGPHCRMLAPTLPIFRCR
jgi:hypothetical protein